ncbi:hypothetical protein O181_085429 [Austropuccinia psidii MF-1]|uniref:Uncharacterized protein n=1 Tax=Austropuccinia psidii MF-1 TaxID=1389203 RepID=A0A9Q3FV07_9BASI|nr:hypothetical protein [Austropuccinia psidii MF-1]
MPKASHRLPLLQTLNSMQFIDALNSDGDSDIQEDIRLLDMITSQRYINHCRVYPSHYMYTMNDLQTLSSEKFFQLCRTTHESFEKLVAQIQDDRTFQNSSQNKNEILKYNWLWNYQGWDLMEMGLLCKILECYLELSMGPLCCRLKELSGC